MQSQPFNKKSNQKRYKLEHNFFPNVWLYKLLKLIIKLYATKGPLEGMQTQT